MKIWILFLAIVLALVATATRERMTVDPVATTSGTTTGGSSVSALGPNSGTGRNKQVFGPQFTALGETGNGQAMDTTGDKVYPELLGGGVAFSKPSTRIDGVGIVAPSKSFQLDEGLPNPKCTGSDESARYFPYSRCPGDRDLIPDPYRVAQSFSAATYSSRREPAPFLTDFSAFQK